MPTMKQVQQHINQLVAQDKKNKKQVGSFYDQALTIIKDSLSAFFVRYAGETGLDYQTVSQQANSWDLNQLENAISIAMDGMQPTDDLNKRLLAARATASIDKRNTLLSIVTATTAIATAKTQKYGNDLVVNSYVNEHRRVSDTPIRQVPKDIQKNSDFNNRVWVHGDTSANAVHDTLNKAIKKTIDNKLLSRLIKDNHDKPIVNNIDSSAQTGISFNKLLTVNSSIQATNSARDTAFSDNKMIDYVTYVTDMDDKVCDICQSYSGATYAVDDPNKVVPVDDTHPNCRCLLVPSTEDGELLDSYNEDEAETANSFI